MRSCIHEYKTKLEKQIGELMKLPVSERNADLVDKLLAKWDNVREIESSCDTSIKPLTVNEVQEWNHNMKNADGSYQGHWTIDQTAPIQNQLEVTNVSKETWNAVMNMIYSDYCEVAKKYNVNTPLFYGDLAKAFINDIDGGVPNDKVSKYFYYIVK